MHPVESTPSRRQTDRGIPSRKKLGNRVRRPEDRHTAPAFLERKRNQKADRRLRPTLETKKGGIYPGPRSIRKLEHAPRQPNKRRRRFAHLRPNRNCYWLTTRHHSQPETRNPTHAGFDVCARSERHSRHTARSRRGIHRLGTRHGLRRTRFQSLSRG